MARKSSLSLSFILNPLFNPGRKQGVQFSKASQNDPLPWSGVDGGDGCALDVDRALFYMKLTCHFAISLGMVIQEIAL
jgi:hypothetical protein